MKIVLYATLSLYILSSIVYFLGLRKRNPEKTSLTLAWLGLLFNLLVLAMRTRVSGRLPLTNGYDFLLCFIFITVLMYLLYGIKYPVKNAGCPVMLIASLLLLTVSFFMPDQSASSGPLAPALKSPWLTVHVLTAAIAYGGFALAAGLALAKLTTSNVAKDDSVYNIVAFSFASLSLSIVFGAIWAEQAWGAYWSWDPKETWALITWIIYAAYLHLHRQQEWRGKPANLMVIAGFIIVLFTFFGVSYLFSGMHSYS
jgi:ABC-type transport system involved in cytochrome c biogenesis permease subunit